MIHYLIKEETLQDIAEAVRNKTEESGEIKVSELANKINSLVISGNTSDATAVSEEIIEGKTAYARGQKITGTMANNGALNLEFDALSQTSVEIPAGYTSGGAITLTSDLEEALAAI